MLEIPILDRHKFLFMAGGSLPQAIRALSMNASTRFTLAIWTTGSGTPTGTLGLGPLRTGSCMALRYTQRFLLTRLGAVHRLRQTYPLAIVLPWTTLDSICTLRIIPIQPYTPPMGAKFR